MFKKVILNILVILLLLVGMHCLRTYNIIKNAYEASSVFNNVSNITITRQVFNKNESGEDVLNATIEYRIAYNRALVIIKDANDKITNVFKVNLENYVVEEFANIENAFIKQNESIVEEPQLYLDNTLCYMTEGRTSDEFFLVSLFRTIRMDNDNYIIKVRRLDSTECDVYLSRNDFSVTKVKELGSSKMTTTYSYELGNVTEEMLDFHNL